MATAVQTDHNDSMKKPANTEATVEASAPLGVQAVRATVEENFPSLWPAVDLGLATCASLLLAENTNPTAIIYVGVASAGKTTVASMFEGANVRRTPGSPPDLLCYRSDKFTPAAFVSQAANRTAKELKSVDLLPKIKDRVLLTPELAPIFRGDDDALTSTFSTVTRVLDGQGLVTDSGTHGQRGSSEEHLFAWIGCTTPLPERAWLIMGQLGSRLFFLLLDTSQRPTVEDLLTIGKGVPYSTRLKECKAAVHAFLQTLFDQHSGVRSVPWDSTRDDENACGWLVRCAMLLAAMRSVPVAEYDEKRRRIYRPGDQEMPYRALAVLTNVARGRALVHGRSHVTMDDVPLIVRVAASSMPSEPGQLLRALIASEEGTLTVSDVQATLGAKHAETARNRMRHVDALGVMEFHGEGTGKAAHLRFRSEWEWCASPEFRSLLFGDQAPVTNPGVCPPRAPVGDEEPDRPHELVISDELSTAGTCHS